MTLHQKDMSKEISYALRHSPEKFALVLDENGWVDVDRLIEALRQDKRSTSIGLDDLINMIDTSEKTS